MPFERIAMLKVCFENASIYKPGEKEKGIELIEAVIVWFNQPILDGHNVALVLTPCVIPQ